MMVVVSIWISGWRDGDRTGHPEQRTNDLPWARQQANFVIEQQDLENWWIVISLG